MATFFLGVRTDGHGFGILIWKHVGTQKISTQRSKLVVSRRSLYASPEDGEAYRDENGNTEPQYLF